MIRLSTILSALICSLAECVLTSPCATYFSTPVIFVGKVLAEMTVFASTRCCTLKVCDQVACQPGQ